MFWNFNYHTGLIIGVICLLVLIFIESRQINEHINRINEENSSDYRKESIPTASAALPVFCIVLLLLVLFLPMK